MEAVDDVWRVIVFLKPYLFSLDAMWLIDFMGMRVLAGSFSFAAWEYYWRALWQEAPDFTN
jgi:hypothetical protein